MKVGAENKKVLIATIVLAVVAIALAIRMIVVLNETPATAATPAASAGQAVQKAPPARRIRGGAQAKLPKPDSLDPTLKLDLLKASEDTEYKGTGRNIFAGYEPPIEKAPDPRKETHVPPPMQCPGDPRCPQPPIPLKFYGFASKPGEAKKVFLSSGDDIFIAAEGEVVNRRYRVLHIGVNSVEIEDVLQNNRQTIPLTQG